MRYFGTAAAVLCAALLGTMFVPGAQADDSNRKTEVTFSGPVEIPGVHLHGFGILPAGTYVFKIVDSQSDRHIVEVFNKEQTTIYATILAIPNYRLKATGKTVITFSERADGQPEALRAWFFPGRNWGEEFVYPKARAVELAKIANTPVLFTAVEIPVEVAEPIKSEDAPVVVELKRAPIMAIKPTGEEVQLAEVVTPPPAEPVVVATAAPAPDPVVVAEATHPAEETHPAEASKLPGTAGAMPLIGIIGLTTLCVAFALRGIAKRVNSRIRYR